MERLDKFLCGAGAGTRSQVKLLLKAGRVTVDDQVCRVPEEKVAAGEEGGRCGQEDLNPLPEERERPEGRPGEAGNGPHFSLERQAPAFCGPAPNRAKRTPDGMAPSEELPTGAVFGGSR